MDKRFKVFHITYGVYPDLEVKLKLKTKEYERKHNLLATGLSVFYDREIKNSLQAREAAVAVSFKENPNKMTGLNRFKVFHISYRLYRDLEALLRLKIIDFEESDTLSHYEFMGFGILSNDEDEKCSDVMNAKIIVMFGE